MDTVRLRAFAHGEVQGVGYRVFARRFAHTLDLRGYARNLSSGSVEVVAEGPRDALESFLNALRRGPPFGRVDAIEAHWETATHEFTTFSIR